MAPGQPRVWAGAGGVARPDRRPYAPAAGNGGFGPAPSGPAVPASSPFDRDHDAPQDDPLAEEEDQQRRHGRDQQRGVDDPGAAAVL